MDIFLVLVPVHPPLGGCNNYNKYIFSKIIDENQYIYLRFDA